ncbi:EamA family transporter [Aquihabitans sp. G128]|uniref:EamA family transporter n=1 Tax=Aquihabitans sp. G128 TaxID=2849779 RepID=UPI001C218D4D|nr:EamA family transporter [Aquihabitans sp. G128]QXC60121.1 EamA family transporter [Aquihabitans sp. G128]
MAIVFALGAAAFYGSADFMGALASRRNAALAVALGAQVAGLAILLVAMPFLGPAAVSPRDLLFGAAAGVFGGLGVVVVYRTLAKGPMSVVAPTTALSASAVPVLAGILLGERPGLSVLGGIAVAFVAVALITRERTEPGVVVARGAAARALLPALGGGAIFGLFFVFLHQTGAGAGLWPLLAARLTSVPILAALVLAKRIPMTGSPRLVGAVVVSGVLDMVANILYLLALRHGMLAVVAALTGLYPASTVLLAQTRLDERLQPIQFAGLGVAVLAAVLVAG